MRECVIIVALAALTSQAQIFKANNNDSLELATSWSTGVAPTSFDVAAWDSTVATPANCANVLGASMTWRGIEILNPAAPVKITTNGISAATLSLGGAGIDLNETATSDDLWLAVALATATNQTWAIKAGRTLTVGDTNLSVNLSSNLTVSGHLKFANNINVNDGGTLTVPDGTIIEPTLAITNETIQVGNNSGGGSVLQTGGTVKVNRTDGTSGAPKGSLVIASAANATATYSLSGGSLIDTTPNSASTVIVGNGSNSSGTLNVSGTGLVQVVGLRLANAGSASATVNLTNGFITLSGGSFDVGRVSTAGVVPSPATVNVYGGTLGSLSGMNVPHGNGPGNFNQYGGVVILGNNLNVPQSGATGNGIVNLNGGTLTLTNGGLHLPDGGTTNTGAVYLNAGSHLTVPSVSRTAGATNAGLLVFNGGTLKPAAGASIFIANNVTVNVASNGAVIDTGGFNISIAAALLHGAGASADGGLTKQGAGTLTLNGANTYNGPTLVSTGTLAISTAAALSASTNISVAAGATLNLSGSGTLDLNSAPTLSGSLAMQISKAGTVLSSDKLALGSGALVYGGTLTVTAIGSALAGGDTFDLFDAPSFGGAFAATNLPAPPAGLAWDTSRLKVDGTIRMVGTSAPPSSPMFTTVARSGTNVLFSGSGGAANGSYYLLTSTNLALPLANWTMIGSNSFDSSGNFILTNAINPALRAQFLALSLSPPVLSPADSSVVQALQNMRDEGFNTYLPPPGGLYINWVYTNPPPPTRLNIQTDGTPDSSPTNRHDRLTDIVYLACLCLYHQRFPLDPQFNAEISRYTNIVQSASDDNFLGSPDERGWIYWVLEDIIPVVPGFAGMDDAQADKFYNQYTKNLGKYPGVTPLFLDFSTNEPGGYYTVANEVEDACVLIVNGRKRGLTAYVTAGENLLAFQKNNSWSTNLLLWPKQMGHVFTDGTKTVIAPPSQEYIYDGVIKPGELGEMTEALIRAEQADPGRGYGAWAKSVLDNLQPAVNGYTLWDSTYGGYFAQLQFTGSTNIYSPSLTYTLDTAYKEVGRFTVVERSFLAANQAGVASYSSNTVAAVHAAGLAAYYAAGHGWPYQENPNWTLYTNPVLQNWVTSEAIGHAVRSILTYQLAAP